MTGPDNHETRPISVAELLARNGNIGSPPPVGGRRRRRRGNTDAVTVAELTGEIPIIGDEDDGDESDEPGEAEAPGGTNGTVGTVAEAAPASGRSGGSGVSAEEMLPDPIYTEADADADDVDEIDEPPSYLHAVREPLFGGRFEDDLRRDEPIRRVELPRREVRHDEVRRDEVRRQVRPATTTAKDHKEHHEEHDEDEPPNRMQQIGRGALIVLQSMLAVAFGAGLFIAFDELWKWNNIVALVLSVLVILGLVVGVRIVRKTEDIASTLIAVAVGALVTLGPLALLQSG
jgi:hypothetical protein